MGSVYKVWEEYLRKERMDGVVDLLKAKEKSNSAGKQSATVSSEDGGKQTVEARAGDQATSKGHAAKEAGRREAGSGQGPSFK